MGKMLDQFGGQRRAVGIFKRTFAGLLVIFGLEPPHIRHVEVIFLEGGIASRLEIQTETSMPDKLPPCHQWSAYTELELDHFKRRRMMIAQQVKQQLLVLVAAFAFAH